MGLISATWRSHDPLARTSAQSNTSARPVQQCLPDVQQGELTGVQIRKDNGICSPIERRPQQTNFAFAARADTTALVGARQESFALAEVRPAPQNIRTLAFGDGVLVQACAQKSQRDDERESLCVCRPSQLMVHRWGLATSSSAQDAVPAGGAVQASVCSAGLDRTATLHALRDVLNALSAPRPRLWAPLAWLVASARPISTTGMPAQTPPSASTVHICRQAASLPGLASRYRRYR